MPDAASRKPKVLQCARMTLPLALGVNLWVVADNVRKGGALNSVQVAEIWAEDYSELYS